MEFEGIVYKILPVVTGTGQRGEWKKQEVVFELPGEFSRKLCVSFWGDKAEDAARLVEGERVSVAINLESREYNGRWFTEARAWKLTKAAPIQPQGSSATMPNADMPPFVESDSESFGSGVDSSDDLPF